MKEPFNNHKWWQEYELEEELLARRRFEEDIAEEENRRRRYEGYAAILELIERESQSSRRRTRYLKD